MTSYCQCVIPALHPMHMDSDQAHCSLSLDNIERCVSKAFQLQVFITSLSVIQIIIYKNITITEMSKVQSNVNFQHFLTTAAYSTVKHTALSSGYDSEFQDCMRK